VRRRQVKEAYAAGARDALRAEAEWLATAHENSHGKGFNPELRRGFQLAAGWVKAHAEHGQTWRDK